MNPQIKTNVFSEIGELEAVILHTPGPEVENMTPLNAERALYSDILNLSVAKKEYAQLSCLLTKMTSTYFAADLLKDILDDEKVKDKLVRKICANENQLEITDNLLELPSGELARQLIQGVPIQHDCLTNFLSDENYALRPLHNFFFTRDASVSIYNKVLIAKMATKVRERESIIMQAIFDHHPELSGPTFNPVDYPQSDPALKIEGGDILIGSEDILLIGIGARTSSQGIDFIVNRLKELPGKKHIIVQELPSKPESFIHLDMTFTFLNNNEAMIYEPLILKPNKYQTVHIEIDNGKVHSIQNVKNIPEILKDLGMDLNLIYCGGRKDPVIQEREQWHSGTNFFAIAPGKVIGYSRNVHTLEEMNKNGYEIIRARDVINGKTDLNDHLKYVITIDGSELSRGGGGIRCMTMPVSRKNLRPIPLQVRQLL